jgi:hypothetical protein
MKQLYTLLLITLLVGCKKERTNSPLGSSGSTAPGFSLQNLKNDLKSSMRLEDFDSLDFTRSICNQVDSVGLYYLRVPFKGGNVAKEFTLLKLDKSGRIKEGSIIQLDGGVVEAGAGTAKVRGWEGNLSISSLNRRNLVNSAIHKGYIDAFHPVVNARETVYGSDELPEVIVVAYVSSGIRYSTWVALTSLFYDSGSGGGGSDGYYGSLDGGGGGVSYNGTGAVGGSYGGTVDISAYAVVEGTMLVDVDTYVDHPAIDVGQYLKCFGTIPDQGASCSVEIFTDIPVDSDPSKLFNYQTRSPGHTFLQLRKSSADGTQVIVQNIGFYPQSNWTKVLDSNPIDSKIVDDGDHEFNASLKMNLSSTAFSSVLGKIQELSTLKYDMDEFNCTDFALEVFNYVRTPLQVPQYAIPGAMGTNPSNTPQGLFVKLKEMQANRDPEVANISLPGVKGWVAYSKGPCY